MATYLIGDIQGCLDPLQRLLDRIRFDPAADRLWSCGDLVNRGGRSLEVLRLLAALPKVKVTLGNHDFALLADAERHPDGRSRNLEFRAILNAHDRDDLLGWLRRQPLVHWSKKHQLLRMHAGVIPQWSVNETRRHAAEVEDWLRGPRRGELLRRLHGNRPRRWKDERKGWGRLRLIVNILTRIRFCDAKGRMLPSASGPPGSQPPGYLPWFDHPHRATQGTTIAFGHWAALGLHVNKKLIGLDTGAVWGGRLTALRLEDEAVFQAPGAPAWSAPTR